MKRYDKREIMRAAWRLYRRCAISFAEALRLAWTNAKRSLAAKQTAAVREDTHTWSGWKQLGFEVIHESKALYKAMLLDPSTRSGTRVKSYFGASQVQRIQA